MKNKSAPRFRGAFFSGRQNWPLMSVASATVVATTGVAGVAGIASAIIRSHKDDNDQKNDPAIVTQEVHRFPSFPALNSYYANESWR